MQPSIQRLLGSLTLTLVLAACGGSQPVADGASADATSTPDGAASSPEAGADSTPDAASSDASAAATAKPSAKEPAGPPETAKDADALVLEITIAPKGKAKLDDAAKKGLIDAANDRIRGSSKLALPTSKGVTAPRKVIANLLVDEPTVDKKKGLTVRLELTGVSKEGQCPLFSLGNNVSMSDGKPDDAGDVAELRKGALLSLMDQLENTAPTVKPTNNCTHNK